MHLEDIVSAGADPTSTVGDPGTQGVVTGTHGIGVSTPSAADVAAATIGLASELHTPNGRTFAMGAESMMLATGVAPMTRLTGSTIKLLGATPKLHLSVAPMQTTCPIVSSF
jgi:hypothetical protein